MHSVACRTIMNAFEVITKTNVLRTASLFCRIPREMINKSFSTSSNVEEGQGARAAARNVVSERTGSLLTVGINRPEARNAVNQETARLLFQELSAFDGDPALSVAVLHGVGGYFCAGYDLKELGHHSASLKLEQDVTKGPAPMGPSRMQLSKPMIAAVSGYAVAGGLELALLADLRVVEQSAIMGVFCRRFGFNHHLSPLRPHHPLSLLPRLVFITFFSISCPVWACIYPIATLIWNVQSAVAAATVLLRGMWCH